MADGGTGDLEGIAWAYDELFHHEFPAAISRDFTTGTPPGSMMSRAVTATADALAGLFVDLVERWEHVDESDRIFHVVVLLGILRELEHLRKLNAATEALSNPTQSVFELPLPAGRP